MDDEPDIFESSERKYVYEDGLDIDVLMMAKSATNAVRLLEKTKFDVVMTDIKNAWNERY